ncbi:hypothetical protein JG688_00012286 [Phytophthora aleatoria]|uniref:Ankyrin repeat-containing domain n=1 Tax=Phytophthora aleatoria TaxID=2496075 RepID=A0A8J5M4Q7_9STRA|nr:hypothetical protein JG688_00012286 [Phytophthora aleatoria]
MKRRGDIDYGVRQHKRLKEANFPHKIRALPHVIERIDLLSMSVEDAAVEAAATNQIVWLQRLLPLVASQVKDQVSCDTTDIAAARGHCEAIKLIYRCWVQPAGSTFANAFSIPKPCYNFDILEALELAVKNENDKIARVICDKSGFPGEILRWAAKHDNLEVLRVVYRFEDDYMEDLYRAMIIAIERGFLEIVKFLTMECGEGLLEYAADEFGFSCPLVTAIAHGKWEVIEYLDTQDMYLDESEDFDATALERAFASAAGKNQLGIMTYLQTKKKFDRTAIDKALNSAASCGHLDSVKYLCDIEGYELSAAALDKAFENAAEDWNLEMVKFLGGKGNVSRASINTAFEYAMNEPGIFRGKADDQLEMLKHLHSKGCIDPEVISEDFAHVARNCHVDVVEYLYSTGSTSISSDIVEKGFRKATRENSIEVVEFLYNTGVVSPKSIEDAFLKAASRGDLYVMEYLFSCGCKFQSLLEKALCKHSSLPPRVLLFLKQKQEITLM